MTNESTQLARSVLLLLDYAERHGIDRASLMRAAGLAAVDVDDPDSRVRTASMLKLWREVIDAQDDPVLGLHIASSISAKQLGLVGYAMYHSNTLRGALNRLARYGRILSDAIQFEIVDTDEHSIFIWQAHPSLVALRHPVELGVALVVSMAREITGSDLVPTNVDLPSPRPEAVGAYRSMFRCPVAFDRPLASVTFSRAQLQLPTQEPDPTLVGYLEDLSAITLAPLEESDESMIAAVRRALWTMLPGGRPDLWRTATSLGVSARTLQRRLGEEGSSFSRVLDELRRDLSDELLSDRKLAVAEVAFLLGYSEPSAFQRAFRRWRGVSPRRFRVA
ncbi:MAG: AraC family transcriptional regulator [Gammaproteobacteria bacterium]|nr:AraC family transcriptional regulator [Gammaproteobacteria bacterium]